MRRINVAIAGFGGVGRAVASLLLARRNRYHNLYGVDVRLVAVCGSRAGLASDEGLEADQFEGLIEGRSGPDFVLAAKPDVLIEAGTYKGGSAYYFASLFDLIGSGRVYTVDIEDHPDKPSHPRITFRKDSSTSDATLAWLRTQIEPGERVMVTLDSSHAKDHVLAELDRYAPLVSPGMYLIVEDSNLGHDFRLDVPEYQKGGPWHAMEEWLPKHPEFTRDTEREKFSLTFNPGGWLRRKAGG